MKKLKKTVKSMVAEAKSKINEIDAKEAIKLFNDENVIFIDIRDIRERQKLGFIPGSFHAPRGMLEFWIDPESPYFKDIFNTNKKRIRVPSGLIKMIEKDSKNYQKGSTLGHSWIWEYMRERAKWYFKRDR